METIAIVLIIFIILVIVGIIIYFVITKFILVPKVITNEIIIKLDSETPASLYTESDVRNIINGYLVELIRSDTIKQSFATKVDITDKSPPYKYSKYMNKIKNIFTIYLSSGTLSEQLSKRDKLLDDALSIFKDNDIKTISSNLEAEIKYIYGDKITIYFKTISITQANDATAKTGVKILAGLPVTDNEYTIALKAFFEVISARIPIFENMLNLTYVNTPENIRFWKKVINTYTNMVSDLGNPKVVALIGSNFIPLYKLKTDIETMKLDYKKRKEINDAEPIATETTALAELKTKIDTATVLYDKKTTEEM